MISVSDFLDAVQRNADRVTAYKLGHDGSDGECDCIGLAIGAIRLAGGKYSGTHGSNWVARHEVTSLVPVSKAEQIRPGMLMIKAKQPGESGWALPEKYKKDADQNDYYHAGVVMSAEPLMIVHCTTRADKGGIYYDTKMGNWGWAAELRQVDYDAEEKKGDRKMTHKVVGGALRLREEPNKNSRVLISIPDGTEVEATALPGNAWWPCDYQGKQGYVMAQYLVPVDVNEDVPTLEEEEVAVKMGGLWIHMGLQDAINLREQLIRIIGLG